MMIKLVQQVYKYPSCIIWLNYLPKLPKAHTYNKLYKFRLLEGKFYLYSGYKSGPFVTPEILMQIMSKFNCKVC